MSVQLVSQPYYLKKMTSSKKGSRRIRLIPDHTLLLNASQPFWMANPPTPLVDVHINTLESVLRDNGLLYIDALRSKINQKRMNYINEMNKHQLKEVVDAITTGYETSNWDDFANLGSLLSLPHSSTGKATTILLDMVTEIPTYEDDDTPEEKWQRNGTLSEMRSSE